MKFEVYWLKFAIDKLDAIESYYSKKAGKKIATNLVKGIIEKSLILEEQPEIGQREPYLIHREQEFRYLVQGNFKIIYWLNKKANRVEVSNVFDARQNPKKVDETK